MTKRTIAIVCAGLTALAGTGVKAETFSIDPSSDGDTVNFRSSAKLEFIEGTTGSITGFCEFNPQQPGGQVSGRLQVDLRTLQTGIDTRDRHMRENHLQTDEFPHAYFEFTTLTGLPSSLTPDSTYQARAGGFFYIHGVRRALAADVEVRYSVKGLREGLYARAKFSIKLDEFQIKRPKALFLKLAETIEVEVIFTAYNDLPRSSIVLPEWEILP